MNTKENKKAPYWLSTLSASCVSFSFGFFTFTVIEYGSNTPFQMMLSGINGLVILIFGSIVFIFAFVLFVVFMGEVHK